MRDRVTETVETARPYVERLARDEDLHEHVKKAYESARKIYDDVIGPVGATGIAMRVARDKELREELQNVMDELREASKRARGETHTGRNMTLLISGIALGVLFNPMTGPDTRRWLKEKMFGPEEPFEYGGSTSGNAGSSSS
jgi:hypothetical protein